jgi:hypothetical protein
MNFKNSKTIYLIFLVIVLSTHTFILTTVLSTENKPTSNVKFNNENLEDSLQNKNFKFIPTHQKLPDVNQIYINYNNTNK